jgi:manganese transport protein
LLWVIVMADLMAVLIQYLTSKAGLATGRSLPELCRERYGRRVNVVLWLQAEVIAMVTDLAEFVGAAVGLNLIFGVPLLLAKRPARGRRPWLAAGPACRARSPRP